MDSLDTFGELLRHLRRRARLTQRDFGIAVGYSEAHIARLERNERRPELATIRTRFLDALDLDREPRLAARLIELAKVAHGAAREQLTTQPKLTNLLVQLTRFIGREREMAELRRLLSDHRLVTLTGTGGVGKTRLAIEVAASVVSQFADGVWLVELAPLIGPESVPRSVAGVFKLPDDPGRALIETLAEHLKEKRLLLLLDNCEHVIAACAQLTENLLRACPDARILATSREPLRVSGEAVWQVPPLATPDPAHLSSLEQILSYEAIQLFVEHTQNAQPDLKLTPAYMATIAHICHQLDGIPLAIEMVAAQVTTMALQEISERLNDRLALTVSGRRTALPRHQTLHAALEWSYNLLSEPERTLLARLSVFADGCTADAAEVVCSDTSKVLPLLLQLVHKSLVVADTREERTRYRLLETVRQFAAEKLNALGETDAIYKRQAAYLIALASEKTYDPATATLSQLEAELGNLRALLAWARTQPDGAEVSVRLVTAFRGLWFGRGYRAGELLAWLEDAAVRKNAVSVELRVAALTDWVFAHVGQGYSLGRWTPQAEEALALSEQVGNPTVRFNAIFIAAYAAVGRMDSDRAAALFAHGLDFSLHSEFTHGIVRSLYGLGCAKLMRHDNSAAIAYFRQALQIAQEHPVIGKSHLPLLGLAFADPRTALLICEQELARQRALDDLEGVALTLQLKAQLLLIKSDYARAEAALDECLALWRRLGVRSNMGCGISKSMQDLGLAAWLQGDIAAAKTWYEQSLEQFRHAGDMGQIAKVQVLLGHTMLAQADLPGASAVFHQGLCFFHERAQPPCVALALAGFGAVAEAQGQAGRAAQLFAAASAPSGIFMLPTTMWPAEQAALQREIAAAHSRFTASGLASAWADGEHMSLDQAVEYALNEAD